MYDLSVSLKYYKLYRNINHYCFTNNIFENNLFKVMYVQPLLFKPKLTLVRSC